MLCFKILLPIITLAIALLEIGLQYRWSEKDSEQHRWTSRVLIFLIILGTFFTVYIVYQDDKSSMLLHKTLNDMQEQHGIEINEANQREQNAINERGELQKELVDMNSKLDPFIELAKSRYPQVNTDVALQGLVDDISRLDKKTDGIDERVEETFERTITPGLTLASINTERTPEGYRSTIVLKPTNDLPLGEIILVAKITGDSESKIINFNPSGVHSNFKRNWSNDRKEFKLTYTPLNAGNQTINLYLSDSGEVTISGNKGIQPFTIRVK